MSVPGFIQLGLAIIFGVTGVLKLYSPSSLKSTLAAIGISKPLSSAGAWLIPMLEVITAILLLSNSAVMLGEIVAFGLTAAFAYASFIALQKSDKIQCNCFGELADEYLGWGTVLRIIMLVIMISYIAVANQSVSFAAVKRLDLVLSIFSWAGLLGLYWVVQFMIKALSKTQTD